MSAAAALSPRNELEQRLETLQRDYADLNAAIFEAAQVHRRLCAPSLIHYGPFDIASEVFAVRHLPGDFFTVAETDRGLVFALGDIGGKGLAAGMWVTHLIGLIRTYTAVSSVGTPRAEQEAESDEERPEQTGHAQEDQDGNVVLQH